MEKGTTETLELDTFSLFFPLPFRLAIILVAGEPSGSGCYE